MLNNPPSSSCQGLAPANWLTHLQQNSLGSGDVFHSLDSFLVESPLADRVLLPDPRFSKGFLPGLSGFEPFSPPSPRPKVACYVSPRFLQLFSVLPVFFPKSEDFMALELYRPQGCFGSLFSRSRIGNA